MLGVVCAKLVTTSHQIRGKKIKIETSIQSLTITRAEFRDIPSSTEGFYCINRD